MKAITIIIGPTASGKSDYAVNLALKIKEAHETKYSEKEELRAKYKHKDSIIISADSRQIYKYLDVGSGKITKEEMRGVSHFALDIAKPDENFTVNDWLIYTENIIRENGENLDSGGGSAATKNIIICGGTGLYIDALLYGITKNPAPDFEKRKELKKLSLEEIQGQIKNINLEFFDNLNNSEQNNKDRLIRKLEILTQNQNKINENHTRILKYKLIEFIILKPELNILEEKIKLRLDKRLESDLLIKEVQYLLENNIYTSERLLSFGLEYKYVTMYLQNKTSYDEIKDNIISKSLQYAKRQMAWNKRYENLIS